MSVSYRSGQPNGQMEGSALKDVESGEKHGRVKDLGVHNLLELSFSIQLYVSHKHVLSWNPDIVKGQIPIVFHLPIELRPNVSNLDAWKGVVILISNSDEERLNSMIFLIRD
jgi:hypothetical protein